MTSQEEPKKEKKREKESDRSEKDRSEKEKGRSERDRDRSEKDKDRAEKDKEPEAGRALVSQEHRRAQPSAAQAPDTTAPGALDTMRYGSTIKVPAKRMLIYYGILQRSTDPCTCMHASQEGHLLNKGIPMSIPLQCRCC